MRLTDSRRCCGVAALALAVVIVPLAGTNAQMPAKAPLRILVGFSAGGTTDLAARLIADQLKELLGRQVIVENRTGASGRVAAVALKNAAPDGTTIMLAPMVVTMLAPMVWSQLDYDPVRDFAPVAHVSNFALALAVNADTPVRTLPEFVEWVKASPARANYGVSAIGGTPHLFGVIVGRESGIPWIAVPYRGPSQMEVDLIGGRIAATFDALSNMVTLHHAGKVRILATSGLQRSALLPDVPTFQEQGFANIRGNGWLAMYAPAGTPAPAIDELATAIDHALRQPQIRERMLGLGFEPTGTDAKELAAIAARDAAYWGPIIKETGFRAD